MRIRQYWLILIIAAWGCGQKQNQAPVPQGPYFSLLADSLPRLLLPGFISTRFGEYNGCFADEGKTFYYTLSLPGFDRIVETRMQEGGSWSSPELASFSGNYAEFDPLISPNGNELLYSAHRPLQGNEERDRSGIWRLRKQPDGSWSEPGPVLLTGRGDYYSSSTREGVIYFNVWNDGDIYRAAPVDTGYQIARLPAPVNAPQGDGDPFIAADESYLIFRSYRPGGPGNGDFYITFNADTGWSTPRLLPEPINSPAREMCPYVTPDGKLFIFASNRLATSYEDVAPATLGDVAAKYDSPDNGQQNIYVMDAGFIQRMKPQ